MGDMTDSGKKTRQDEIIFKPDIIVDYNINLRLVDKSDMMIGSVECVRKTVKWYKKLFFHMVDVCLLNSYLYYKRATGKRIPFCTFMHDLVDEILQKYGTVTKVSRGRSASAISLPDSLLGKDYMFRHCPSGIPIPPGERRPRHSHPVRDCVVCMQSKHRPATRKHTSYQCLECKVPLCIEPCFRDYHALVEY